MWPKSNSTELHHAKVLHHPRAQSVTFTKLEEQERQQQQQQQYTNF